MEKKKSVSMAVIKRLPKYHRYLKELMRNDVDRISSKELGEKIGFTASQIRQDLDNKDTDIMLKNYINKLV